MKGLSKILFYGMAAMVAAVFIASCMNNNDIPQPDNNYDPNVQLTEDIVVIDSFLAVHNLDTAVLYDSLYGMRLIIHSTDSSGNRPQSRDRITTDYVLYGLDSTKHDSSYDRGVPFTFSFLTESVILGFDVGFYYLQEGDSATFYVPSPMAYGPNQQGTIPPNSILIFNVKFKSLN